MTAAKVGIFAYLCAAICFSVLVYSYYTDDALKVQTDTITVDRIAGAQCKSLGKLIKTVELPALSSSKVKDSSTICGSYDEDMFGPMTEPIPVISEGHTGGAVVMIDQYFTDADDCKEKLRLTYGTPTVAAFDCDMWSNNACPEGCKISDLSITAEAPYTSGFTFDVLYNGLVSYNVECDATCKNTVDQYWIDNAGTGNVDSGDPVVKCGSSGDSCPTSFDFKALVDEVSPNLVSTVCDAWMDNPPYQCTTFERLSTVSIFSQSFALTSTAVGLLYLGVNIFLNHFYNAGEDEEGSEGEHIDVDHLIKTVQIGYVRMERVKSQKAAYTLITNEGVPRTIL